MVETPFLSEAELPDYAKLSNDPSSMDTDAHPQSHNEAAAATSKCDGIDSIETLLNTGSMLVQVEGCSIEVSLVKLITEVLVQ